MPGYDCISHHILESVWRLCIWQTLNFPFFMFEICSLLSPHQYTPYKLFSVHWLLSFLLQHFQLVHVLIRCTTNSPYSRTLYLYTRLIGHSWRTMFRLVPSPHQWTPLHLAALQGKEGTVQLLIEKGADINIKDRCGVRDCVLVLLIRGYDVHNCVANPQSLSS